MNFKNLTLVMLIPAMPFTATAETTSNATETFETVTVTAKGLEDNITDVPFTVNVIDGEDIENRQHKTTQDVLSNVPGVSFHQAGEISWSGIWIRGAGSMSQTTTLDDNSVGVMLDGVSIGKVGLTQTLYDVEQIEVSKGPQGTIMGSNTEAGSVQIKTNNPEFDFDSHIGVTLADNQTKEVQAMVNAPLSDTVALRVSGLFNQRDHYVYEKGTNKPVNELGNQGIRAKLLWQPNENTKTLITAFHDKNKNHTPLSLVAPFDKDKPTYTKGDVPLTGENKTNGLGIEVSHGLTEAIKLTSNTTYHSYTPQFEKGYLPYDVVQVPSNLQRESNYLNQTNDIEQYEQDIRLSSQKDAKIQWVAGLYLSDKDRNFIADTNLILAPSFPPANIKLNRDYRIKNQAVYGETNIPVSEKTKILIGARATQESNDMTSSSVRSFPNTQFPVATNRENIKLKDKFITWRLGANHTLNSHWNAYGLYSKGHKSEGFNDYNLNIVSNLPTPTFKSGHVNGIELGFKGADTHGKWFTTFSAFRNDTTNEKISTPDPEAPTTTLLSSNVDTTTQGLEFDGQFYMNSALSVNTAIAYTDTEVTKVPNSAVAFVQKGNQMPMTPKISGALGLSYHQNINANYVDAFKSSLNINHIGKRAAQPNNTTMLEAYTTLDASVGLAGNFGEVTLWSKNLTNEESILFYVDGTSPYGLPGEGRVIGMSYGLDF